MIDCFIMNEATTKKPLGKFPTGSFIKCVNEPGRQWKILTDNGIWYEIYGMRERKMLFHRIAHKHWVMTASNDDMS